MSQEVITKEQGVQHAMVRNNSAALAAGVNRGSVAIEQERAVAEAEGQLKIAKMFPRDLTAAHAELMRACKSPAFAQVAFYTVPNRGSGPSIRFAEEVARVFGNFEFGHRELSRDANKSEVLVYAWDKQQNNMSVRQLTIEHVLYTKAGGNKKLIDPTDIDNRIANVAAKQMRGRILALMPKWLVQEGIDEAKKTLAGNNDEPIEARVRRMTQAFAKYGVTTEHLQRYLDHSLDEILADEIVDLTGIYNALKEGAKPSEYFGAAEAEEAKDKTAAAITETAAKNNATEKSATAQATNKKPTGQTSKKEPTKEPAKPAKPKEDPKPKPDPTPSETVEEAAAPEAEGNVDLGSADDDGDVF